VKRRRDEIVAQTDDLGAPGERHGSIHRGRRLAGHVLVAESRDARIVHREADDDDVGLERLNVTP